MDKLMDSRWFIKVVTFLLALLLFSTVNFDPQKNKRTTEESVASNLNEETISDVPVTVIYDKENLIVSGIPDTVSVTVEGPVSIVQSAKAMRNFEVFVDLTNASIGTQRVPIQIRDISDKLKVTIEPANINVNVQERITKEFNVEAEFNRTMVEEGFISEQPIVEPNKVKITGAKNIIDRISYVKAMINYKGKIDSTITQEASIRVLDKELNKLDVIVEPEIVQVTLPVKRLSKIVPIKIVSNGTPPNGVSIESMGLDAQEATIFAREDILNKTESVRVEVDLSKITNSQVLTLPVIISEGITKVNPELANVNVKVNVRTEEEKVEEEEPKETTTTSEISEISIPKVQIKSTGLAENYKLTFLDPADEQTSLSVSGPSNIVKKLTPADFELVIDASNLQEGEHNIRIQGKGPQNVTWKMGQETAKISIVQKE
ncbi:YbbR-like domain-containing protein [Bacillus aquiflavi]|uniref:YbbR-like domain-containing protein n=1 Tax=Bacillus aquiflavi TaxID=2672567 RepID=A0A6B3W2H4_9BACI|nr:CdaR family protein [Bacillus aquiflavi]MBA4537840.1 YbbR-like domain-containing protein [Bacillus aquiflavi]NEY82096.1 YbbR-like domain-containing protein [Bacillus aquiflavi]UAC48342.1 YbbR-like domain-containing protein [Bacillus aquiflavi]